MQLIQSNPFKATFLVVALIAFSLMSVIGCQNSSKKLSCPNSPSFSLDIKKVDQAELSSTETKRSGMLSGRQSAGYIFIGQKGQKFNYQVQNSDACLYLFDPDNKLLYNNVLLKDGKYIIQIENIQGAGSFDIIMSLTNKEVVKISSSSTPDISPSSVKPENSRIDPSQFLTGHYQKLNQAIQSRNYDVTWDNLSNSFRSASGESPEVSRKEYEEWWNTVKVINLHTAKTVSNINDKATLRIRISYTMNNNQTVIDRHSYMFLIWDDNRQQWLINGRK
jgi:hypothetical protein